MRFYNIDIATYWSVLVLSPSSFIKHTKCNKRSVVINIYSNFKINGQQYRCCNIYTKIVYVFDRWHTKIGGKRRFKWSTALLNILKEDGMVKAVLHYLTSDKSWKYFLWRIYPARRSYPNLRYMVSVPKSERRTIGIQPLVYKTTSAIATYNLQV